MRKSIVFIGVILLFGAFACHAQKAPGKSKPTICLVGGTPSSAKILEEMPLPLKAKYHFISFNRPGYGNTSNAVWDKEQLFELAKQAGLKRNDFAVIGVSGGGPLAILLAHEFSTKHCGVISGMVPAEEYFAYADSTFTKPLMVSVLKGYDEFARTVAAFPNVEEILKQANSPLPQAIRASYDDLHFILSEANFDTEIYQQTPVTWLHGEDDKNVAAESAQLFLAKFKNKDLRIIPKQSHAIDSREYIKKLLSQWEK